MAWFIDPDINDGYPWQSEWPQEAQTDWSGELPYSAWRIQEGVNDNYPWIWWWFKESSDRSGEMLIGGSQTNYPNGFSSSDRGGIRAQFTSGTMAGHGAAAERVQIVLNSVLSGRQFLLTASDLSNILAYINDPDNVDSNLSKRIAELYGANIYDAFLVCKAYPFWQDPGVSTVMKLYGSALFSPGSFSAASSCMWEHSFGSLDLDVQQAYEVESTDYSIYLPFCGVYPLDVRDGSSVSVIIRVDMFHGLAEYQVMQNGQTTGMYKCNIGVDVPLNFNQGIMSSNLSSMIMSMVTSGLPLVGSLVGGAVGGTVGSTIGGSVAGMAANAINTTSGHHQITAPSVGSLAGLYSYPTPRIIAKIPKMFKDGYGYSDIIGESRQCTYTQLSSCSGFTQCKDYKCDIIIATDSEKVEIERLLNAGVFL